MRVIRIPKGQTESTAYPVIFGPPVAVEAPAQPSQENIKVWVLGKHAGNKSFFQVYPPGESTPCTFMLKGEPIIQKFSPECFKGLLAIKFCIDTPLYEDLSFSVVLASEMERADSQESMPHISHTSIHITLPGQLN